MKALFLLALLAAPLRAAENCTACHARLRDDRSVKVLAASLGAPERDVVVVGGGISGLAAAWFLRDLDVLVLEKEARAGGHERNGEWRGVEYPLGAVYFNAEPYGAWKELFDGLGLKLRAEPGPHTALVKDGRLVEEPWTKGLDELPYPPETVEGLRRFNLDMEAWTASERFSIPVEDSAPDTRPLDALRLTDFLSERYGAGAGRLIGRMVQDMLGAEPAEYSALAGLTMLAVEDEYYTWPGGLHAVADAAAAALGDRVRTGALVTQVASRDDRVTVWYETAAGKASVSARAVIVAAPPHVARRVLMDVSGETLAALKSSSSSAYATAMFGFEERVWDGAYMLWSDTGPVTSVVWSRPASPDAPQVAVAYMPLGSEASRRRLEQGARGALERAARRELERLVPGASKKAAEFRLSLWGHAIPIAGPGWLTGPRERLAAGDGRVFFAGEALQVPCVEGAVYAGQRAALAARAKLGKPSHRQTTPSK